MNKEKRLLYQKAYVELYEMIKLLSDEERRKIPEYFIEYIYNNMDTNYNFSIDTEKGLLDQDYMVETKALIVKLYEKYFAPESEKEFWNDYHKLCFNMIEEEKRSKYNSNEIFGKKEEIQIEKKSQESENNLPVEVKKEKFFERIFKLFRKAFYIE